MSGNFKLDMWVRVLRGKHEGDLGYIARATEPDIFGPGWDVRFESDGDTYFINEDNMRPVSNRELLEEFERLRKGYSEGALDE